MSAIEKMDLLAGRAFVRGDTEKQVYYERRKIRLLNQSLHDPETSNDTALGLARSRCGRKRKP